MITKFLQFGARFPLIAFAIVAAMTALLGLGLEKLKIDTSLESLIAEGEPTRPAYERIVDEFGSDNTTIVYLKDADLWTPEKLQILDELHYAFEDIEYVEKVDSLYTARSIRDVEGDLMSDTVLLDPPYEGDEDIIEEARDNALYSPLLRGNFISDDGLTTALVVKLRPGDGIANFDSLAQAAMKEALDPYRDEFEEAFQIGSPRINAELETNLIDDLTILAPGASAVLMITIMIFLRSGFAAVIPLVSAILAIVWTFGMMGHTGVPLNVLSAMLPSLIIVIGSTEDTHMLAVYFQELGSVSASKKREIRKKAAMMMARHVGVPVLLTTLTTFLGFVANASSEIQMIKDFAYASAFGVAANGLITILFVPLILSLIGPTKTSIMDENQEVSGFQKVMLKGLDYLRERQARPVLVATVILCLLGVWQMSGLVVSNAPLTYFQKTHPLIGENRAVHEDLAGINTFYITLESDEPAAFKTQDALNRLLEIQKYMDEQGEMDMSISIANQLALVHREFNGGDPAFFEPPEDAGLIDQYMLFFQRRDVENYISYDFSRANIVVRHDVNESYRLKAILADLEEKVAEVAGEEYRYYIVGKNNMINNAADRLITAQVQSLGLLMVVIFIMMSILFTSWRGGAISLVPNLVPIIFTFGVMGLFDIPLNPGTATVAVIAIGIAIDDTIHLLTKFNEESRTTPDQQEAVRRTVKHEAIPVISTSISLFVGFGVLLFSNFSIVAQFGILAAITMIFAMVADLLITPIAMSRIRLVSLADILALKVDMGVVKASPLFEGMSNFAIKKTILLCQVVDFKAGDVIIKQGDTGNEMYMIVNGIVDVNVHTDTGVIKVAEESAGSVLGEVGFTSEVTRTAEVRAQTEVQMLTFNADQLRQSLRFYPHISSKIYLNISRILGRRLKSAQS